MWWCAVTQARPSTNGRPVGTLSKTSRLCARSAADRQADGQREPVGSDPAQHGGLVVAAELLDSLIPRDCATRGPAERLGRLLCVARAHLLQAGVVALRRLADVASVSLRTPQTQGQYPVVAQVHVTAPASPHS